MSITTTELVEFIDELDRIKLRLAAASAGAAHLAAINKGAESDGVAFLLDSIFDNLETLSAEGKSWLDRMVDPENV